MDIKIRRVNLRKEAVHLCEMDVKIFGSDGFDATDDWQGLKCFWVILQGKKIGSIAFKHDSAIAREYEEEYHNVPGSLYIVSTGLLPKFQRKGIGVYLKRWEIDYARSHGFKLINTHCRASNLGSYKLNKKFGFVTGGFVKGYYKDPIEDAIVLELHLEPLA